MLFALPEPCDSDTPMSQLHVWHWAKTQPRADVDLHKYLASLGFVVGQHRITEAQYKTLDWTIDHFHRSYPLFTQPLTFAECFTAAPDGFYVCGKPGRYSLAPNLADALRAAGWTYDVAPGSMYFQITHGILWAKHQQIIVQRALVEILQ